ncbi:hypothetical protein BE04_32650 [Sorangium cellulosum]|uniref:Uncharacterized protein n=1 Tax=Sorangium cellulosum TaxID=56 RepID=A0A150PJB4_SORCE|nr:hypothetical protein BE04_32650 [Sorangium cellulosum]
MSDELAHAIEQRVSGRFVVDGSGDAPSRLADLSPPALAQRRVLRLSRTSRRGAGWRTLLLATIAAREDYQHALRWAADVRQALPEPEASDLYLILSGSGLKDFDRETIEANEHFCRKLVVREEASLDEFLNRSFLAWQVASNGVDATLVDPLTAALNDVVKKGLLSAPVAQRWRAALASIHGGKDLAEQLRSDWMTGRAPS